MTIAATEMKQRLEFAIAAAQAAGDLILGFYQAEDLEIILKGDQTPVTAADRGAEELLRRRIEQTFPQDGILGEEYGEKIGTNGCRWILDPIDGTKPFVHGVPLFGVLVGLEYNGELVVGVCRFPALNEVVYAAKDTGAYWQIGTRAPRKIQVNNTASLTDSLFCTTTILSWDEIKRRDAHDKICAQAKMVRGWGDCYGHMLVATGRADVMIDPVLSPWDAAALVPIIREAGGFWGDFQGNDTIHAGNGFSCTPQLKDEVLAILQG